MPFTRKAYKPDPGSRRLEIRLPFPASRTGIAGDRQGDLQPLTAMVRDLSGARIRCDRSRIPGRHAGRDLRILERAHRRRRDEPGGARGHEYCARFRHARRLYQARHAQFRRRRDHDGGRAGVGADAAGAGGAAYGV